MTTAVPDLPSWTSRLRPAQAPAAADRRLLLTALAVGLLASTVLSMQGLGLGTVLVGAAVLAVALCATSPSRERLLWAGVALLLLVVVALRAAEWLAVLCLLGAMGTGALALVGARTWTGLALTGLAPVLVLDRWFPWLRPAVDSLLVGRAPVRRGLAVAAVTTSLLLVFGSLFATADPAFASVLGRLLPDLRVDTFVQRVVLGLVATVAALLAALLAQAPPVVDALAPAPGRPVRRWEWVLPLAVLDLLFLAFVVVQLSVLFGGRDHVLRTEGLTYAQYARSGFWQLLVVTLLTLLVIAVAVRTGPRATSQDRLLLRLLLGTLCTTALVVVASAVQRMALYQQEYGYTRLRLLVDAIELSLGAVYVLLLVAGLRLSGAWLPRAVVGVGAAALLGLAALNPDAWIAERNVQRYEETGRLDLLYLSQLSADAVPAMFELPGRLRGCAVATVAERLRTTDDPWWDLNVARARARETLEDEQLTGCSTP